MVFEIGYPVCVDVLECLMIAGIGNYACVFNDKFDYAYAYLCKI